MILPEKVVKKIDEAYRQLNSANQHDHDVWFNNVMFSWQWWMIVFLTFLPWVLWWIWRNKESTGRLLYGGLFIATVSTLFDSYGAELGLWDYRYEFIPFLPSFITWDLSHLPVIFMFIIQVRPKSSPIVKAIIYSTINSFIGEPIFEWLGYYYPMKWSVFYSLPIHFTMFLIGYYLVMKSHFKALH